MKKNSETNQQIKDRLKYQLDGNEEDEMYAVKILLGFEPLDEWSEIRKKISESESTDN